MNNIGKKYGSLTIIKIADKRINHSLTYTVKCDCGTVKDITFPKLSSGHTTSCGCKRGNRIDITNQRFGRVVVLNYHDRVNNNTLWNCICDCGKEFVGNGRNLRNGSCKSCGCLNTEVRKSTIKDKVGHVNGTSLSQLKDTRKLNSNNTSGVRGISWSKEKQKWVAQITYKRKYYNLGSYEEKSEAIKVRKEAEEFYFKEKNTIT